AGLIEGPRRLLQVAGCRGPLVMAGAGYGGEVVGEDSHGCVSFAWGQGYARPVCGTGRVASSGGQGVGAVALVPPPPGVRGVERFPLVVGQVAAAVTGTHHRDPAVQRPLARVG